MTVTGPFMMILTNHLVTVFVWRLLKRRPHRTPWLNLTHMSMSQLHRHTQALHLRAREHLPLEVLTSRSLSRAPTVAEPSEEPMIPSGRETPHQPTDAPPTRLQIQCLGPYHGIPVQDSRCRDRQSQAQIQSAGDSQFRSTPAYELPGTPSAEPESAAEQRRS